MKQRVSRRHVCINNAIKWHTIIKTQQGAMRNIGTICFVHNTTLTRPELLIKLVIC